MTRSVMNIWHVITIQYYLFCVLFDVDGYGKHVQYIQIINVSIVLILVLEGVSIRVLEYDGICLWL